MDVIYFKSESESSERFSFAPRFGLGTGRQARAFRRSARAYGLRGASILIAESA
jgi:hypothetical protein